MNAPQNNNNLKSHHLDSLPRSLLLHIRVLVNYKSLIQWALLPNFHMFTSFYRHNVRFNFGGHSDEETQNLWDLQSVTDG